MNLSQQIDDFLNYLEFNKKASRYTLKNYRYYLARFNEFYSGQKSPEINQQFIDSYRKFLDHPKDESGENFSLATKNYFLIALRSFLNFLNKEKGFYFFDPSNIKLLSSTQKSPENLSDQSLSEILGAVDLKSISGQRDYLVITILNATGLKVSELSSLNRDSIDIDSGRLHFTDKHGMKRNFKISNPTLEVLVKHLVQRRDEFKPLFIRFKGTHDGTNQGENMRLTARSIERLVEKYVKKTGLATKITPQQLRHNFALGEAKKGLDLDNLRLTLGHLSQTSSKLYLKALNKNP